MVVTTEEQYPQHILIEFTQDKCDLLNTLKVGEDVTIGINLRGREWVTPQNETRYFNSIQGWKVDKVSGQKAVAPTEKTVKQVEKAFAGSEDEPDDLPF